MGMPIIKHVRAFTVRGGGADYHDQGADHWIDDHIATPMGRYPEYRQSPTQGYRSRRTMWRRFALPGVWSRLSSKPGRPAQLTRKHRYAPRSPTNEIRTPRHAKNVSPDDSPITCTGRLGQDWACVCRTLVAAGSW